MVLLQTASVRRAFGFLCIGNEVLDVVMEDSSVTFLLSTLM